MKRLAEEVTTPLWMPREIVTQLVLAMFHYTLLGRKQYEALLVLRLVDKEWACAIGVDLLRQIRCIDDVALRGIIFCSNTALFGIDDMCDVVETVVRLFCGCDALSIMHHGIVHWVDDAVPRMPALRSLAVDTIGLWPASWNQDDALVHIRRLCIVCISPRTSVKLPPQLETLWYMARNPDQRWWVPVIQRDDINAHKTLRHYLGYEPPELLTCATLVSKQHYTRKLQMAIKEKLGVSIAIKDFLAGYDMMRVHPGDK